MNIFEPGQNREMAALRINVHVHLFFLGDIMNVDDFYMKKAFDEAKKAYVKNEIPVGAIIVLNGTIIARAHNLKNSTGIATNHAEIIAIQKANNEVDDWRLSGAVMYVTLEPCPMCASAIQQSRISKVIYAASSGCENNLKIISSILNNPDSNHITEIYKNIKYEKKSIDIINSFFKKIR